jgi:hypothetical protein
MKSILSAAMVGAVLAFATVASAAPFTVEQMGNAATMALKKWETDFPADAAGFVGYKIWRSTGTDGDDIVKVKVYVTTAGTSVERNYYCEIHPAPTGLECHPL